MGRWEDGGVWEVWGERGERFLHYPPTPPTPPTPPACPMPHALTYNQTILNSNNSFSLSCDIWFMSDNYNCDALLIEFCQ